MSSVVPSSSEPIYAKRQVLNIGTLLLRIENSAHEENWDERKPGRQSVQDQELVGKLLVGPKVVDNTIDTRLQGLE